MELIFVSLSLALLSLGGVAALDIDPKGYIMFCPCMGRFGNQAEHYLGAIAFAKGLDRTLVLPPWVEYPPSRPGQSVQIPFKTYFRVDVLAEYHRVITMEDFMETLAPEIWPEGKRTVFCYSARNFGKKDDSAPPSCNAKDGNPFGPFWDNFSIDFDYSEFYGPLYYDTYNKRTVDQWTEKFPVSKYPVMAFTGAPAAFPIKEENVPLMKYLVWSDNIKSQAEKFVQENIPEGPWLGIHMRNGIDWSRACEHTGSNRANNLFASAQCLGYRMEHGQLTEEICLPKEKTILKQIKKTVKTIKAKAVFVAADSDYMIDKIDKYLKGKVKVVRMEPPGEPHVDLAILGMADHYIGNCVSTFSAFATRQRLVHGNKPTSFWAFNKVDHDEL